MASEWKEQDGFLPDLGNEITGEQLFEQKVFRANEAFIHVNEEITSWFKSPVEQRCYPKSHLNNKNAWHKQMKRYAYNTETGVLYKIVRSCNEIG